MKKVIFVVYMDAEVPDDFNTKECSLDIGCSFIDILDKDSISVDDACVMGYEVMDIIEGIGDI